MTNNGDHPARPLYARTAVGLHETLLPVLCRMVPPPASVLDLGAGTGALAERLCGAGYRVSAVDLDEEHFVLPSVTFHRLDLNGDFSGAFSEEFDLITAVEVIEHVENPRSLLRQARKLLNTNGKLVITTPNIESVPGRIRFLRTGMFRMFDRDPSYNEPTHITPIQTFMMERMLADCDLKLSGHEYHEMPLRPVTRVISRLLEPMVSGARRGDNHIFIIQSVAKQKAEGACA